MQLHISILHFQACYPGIYIQLGNIILDKNNVAKLINFSLSMSIPEGQLHVQVFHICGKHGYAILEYSHMGYLIENANVYSFGVLIITLLAGGGSCLYNEYDYEAYNLVDWPMLWYNATERIIMNVPGESDV